MLKNFNKFDYIIHCAGSGTVGLPFQKDYRKNVIPTKSILKFVKQYISDIVQNAYYLFVIFI